MSLSMFILNLNTFAVATSAVMAYVRVLEFVLMRTDQSAVWSAPERVAVTVPPTFTKTNRILPARTA